MPKRFYKFKLLLDENMPPRQRFPRLNSRFDVKHIRDDLHQAGLKDPPVHELAKTLNRLIITFNGDDFKKMVVQSTKTGVINISQNLRNDQIDTKLTALLTKSSPSVLFSKFTDLTGETEV
jgi:predicted nuclease of predicted toxin-antitoxin system